MRVKVTTLCIDMTKSDSGAVDNISRNVLHAFGVKSGLEFRRHEAITFSRVHQAEEVDAEHCNIEAKGDDNETEESGKEMLEPQAL
jgi:hypothetical protein